MRKALHAPSLAEHRYQECSDPVYDALKQEDGVGSARLIGASLSALTRKPHLRIYRKLSPHVYWIFHVLYRLIFRFLISTGFFTLDESCPSQVLHRERGPDGAPAAAGSGDTLLGSADVDLCSEFSAAAARPESPSTPGIT